MGMKPKVAFLRGPAMAHPSEPVLSQKHYGEVFIGGGNGKAITGEIQMDNGNIMVDFGDYCEVHYWPYATPESVVQSLGITVENIIRKP